MLQAILNLYLLKNEQEYIMNNSIKLLALLFIFCLSCTTDSTNEEDVNDPTDPTPNTTALLKRTVTQDDSGEDYIINYIYDGTKLIGYNESDSFNASYTYENDLVVREDGYIGTLHEFYVIYEYDTNNQLTQAIIYFLLSGTSAIRNVYTYLPNNEISTKSYNGDHNTQDVYSYETIDTYSNGNWTKRRFVEDGEELIYTYDNQNGASKNMHLGTFFQLIDEPGFGATNNPIFLDGTVYEYVYNSDNYPVSATFYIDDEPAVTSTTQYFYE